MKSLDLPLTASFRHNQRKPKPLGHRTRHESIAEHPQEEPKRVVAHAQLHFLLRQCAFDAETSEQAGCRRHKSSHQQVPLSFNQQDVGDEAVWRSARIFHSSWEDHQEQSCRLSKSLTTSTRERRDHAGWLPSDGFVLHIEGEWLARVTRAEIIIPDFVDQKVASTGSRSQHENLGRDRKRGLGPPVHDVHERILHSTKGKSRDRCLRSRQLPRPAYARLWYHRRPIHEGSKPRRTLTDSPVDLPARYLTEKQTGSSTSRQSWLSRCLLLPPRPDRHRVCLFRLSVNFL